MRIAIHQPNFCPVKGYFDKIAKADLFIIMIWCQWEKGKYQNRFHADERWHTMGINHGLEFIADKKYTNPSKDWAKIRKRYKKLEAFDQCISESLYRTNSAIILEACQRLGIDTPIVYDYPNDLKGTDRLIDLCRCFKATEYISGPSGRKYLELEKFGAIKVGFIENTDLMPLVNLL